MTSDWYFAMNNGNGTFTKQLACSLGVYDQDFTEKDDSRFNCQVYDFDLDGKSDVVITKAMYDKKVAFFRAAGANSTQPIHTGCVPPEAHSP